jgi:hypothetical protein
MSWPAIPPDLAVLPPQARNPRRGGIVVIAKANRIGSAWSRDSRPINRGASA